MRPASLLLLSCGLSFSAPRDLPAQFPDSAAVLSQLRGKTLRILREGLKNKSVRRAEIVDLDFGKTSSLSSVNVRLFTEGNSAFRVVGVDTSLMSGVRVLKLKNSAGRFALFAVTEKGVTGKIYADIYNPYSCKIVPAEGSKHLLMEIEPSREPMDNPHQTPYRTQLSQGVR